MGGEDRRTDTGAAFEKAELCANDMDTTKNTQNIELRPRRCVLLGKLTVSQKVCTFYRNRRFITVFTTARLLSLS
jgi:hypothetical protein